jgi:hypothetical protein
MNKRTIGLLGPPVRCPWNRKAFGIGLLAMVIVISTLASSCMDIRFQMGRQTDPSLIEKSLLLKESTTADVLAALGEPFGKGKAMLPLAHPTARTMWTYYYGEGDMKDGRGMYVFVFFDQDCYDGYMWFSNLAKQSPK